MKLNVFTLIAAIIILIFGLGFFLIPVQLVALYGSQLDTTGAFIGRYCGAALLGLAVTWFTARNAKTIETMLTGGLMGGLTFGIVGLIVAIWDGFAGTHNSMVWINSVIFLFISIGFAYFYFKK